MRPNAPEGPLFLRRTLRLEFHGSLAHLAPPFPNWENCVVTFVSGACVFLLTFTLRCAQPEDRHPVLSRPVPGNSALVEVSPDDSILSLAPTRTRLTRPRSHLQAHSRQWRHVPRGGLRRTPLLPRSRRASRAALANGPCTPANPVHLPVLEDLRAVQIARARVRYALAASHLERKTVNLMFWALRLAASNLLFMEWQQDELDWLEEESRMVTEVARSGP